MSATWGINTNNDATAVTQGAPESSITRKHDLPLEKAKDTLTNHHNDDEGINEKSSASPAETLGEDDDSEMERRNSIVQALARTYSITSGHHTKGQNPWEAADDSPLNPSSPNFSAREWAKSIAEIVQDEGNGGFRSAGVCFQHLNVHGYGESSDYQKDVGNVWLSLGSQIGRLMGGKSQRIDILRDFDGVVNKGEMLVVLGPPGSGCSTTLKTIAGELNGIHVDESSYFNYQGKSCPNINAGDSYA